MQNSPQRLARLSPRVWLALLSHEIWPTRNGCIFFGHKQQTVQSSLYCLLTGVTLPVPLPFLTNELSPKLLMMTASLSAL